MKKQLQQIYDKVQCVAAVNIAQHLAPFIQQDVTSNNLNAISPMPSVAVTSATPSFNMVPATPPSSTSAIQPTTQSIVNNAIACVPSSSVIALPPSTPSSVNNMMPPANINPMIPIDHCSNSSDGPPVGAVTEATTTTYTQNLLTSAEITPIYLKSRNRRNFAALLVERLFDVETRLKSNVSGRGKEKLDPEIIKYVKAKVFEFYECSSLETKTEWAKCVVSIDDKSRSLKKRKSP